MDKVVVTKDLKKSFPARKKVVQAVRGVDLNVSKGEIFGFLGPNGAGKTTTLRMLTTLLPPDSGEAMVAGFDISKHPNEVRKRIGYVSQAGGADRSATGLENLLLHGRLYGMSYKTAEDRANMLLKLFQLDDLKDRMISTYSGGQRRRLDVALGIMHKPKVLFLDEPTTGLDPQSRAHLWDQMRQLRSEETTIFLTSHYLDEVDFLSDRLAIMDQGILVAEGTPRELKKQIAGDVVTIGLRKEEKLDQHALGIFKQRSFVREATLEASHMRLYVDDGESALPQILRILDHEKIGLQTIALSIPTLDDVFLRKTGRSLREEETNKEEVGAKA